MLRPENGSTSGAVGHAPVLRLQPEQPAAGRGNADRARAVRADRRSRQARGHRHTRASGGAAGRAVDVPGIAGGAVGRRLGPRRDRQLGHVRLAEDHRARRPQAADDLGVGRCGAVREQPKAVASPATSTVVLDRDRHAQQRPRVACAGAAVGLPRLGPRALGEHHPVGVEQRVQALDPLEVELDQLARGDLAAADELGLARGAGKGEVGGVHGAGEAIRWRAMRRVVDGLGGFTGRGACTDAERRAAHRAARASARRSSRARRRRRAGGRACFRARGCRAP